MLLGRGNRTHDGIMVGCRAGVQKLCLNMFLVFYQLVKLFPERRDMAEADVVVVCARQAGVTAPVNGLIHVDFCLSPADDSEFSDDEKLVQRAFRERQ